MQYYYFHIEVFENILGNLYDRGFSIVLLTVDLLYLLNPQRGRKMMNDQG